MGSERRRIEGESVLGLVDEHAHEFEGAEHGGDQGVHAPTTPLTAAKQSGDDEGFTAILSW
jgi:hypothetical protein